MAAVCLAELGVPALKGMATELGIKTDGTGWPTCCPPSGIKADIVAAIRKRRGDAVPAAPTPAPAPAPAPAPKPEPTPEVTASGHQSPDDGKGARKVPIPPLPDDKGNDLPAHERDVIVDVIQSLPAHSPDRASSSFSPELIASLKAKLAALETGELDVNPPQICVSKGSQDNRMDHEHFGLQKEDIRAKGRDLGQRDPRRMRAKAKDHQTMALLKTLANKGTRGGKARVVDNPQAIYLDFERLGKIGFHPTPDPDDPGKTLIQPTPGNEWEVFYQAAQKLAPVMLFCISRRWNASQWCHQELERYKELHSVTRPAQIADAYFIFFDKTEDETAPGAVHDQWDALVDGCCYLSDDVAGGTERQHNPRQMGFWGGAKNKNTSSENRRLGAMLAKRYEDGGMKSRLSKRGYSVLLQHLLSTVINNYDALAGAGVRRPLMPDLEDPH